MIARRIEALLARVDGTGSREESAAVQELKRTREGLAHWLLRRYRASRNWKARRSCAYFASFDRTSEDALTLGREAIRDRSKHVRYRACQLLAEIQRKDVLPDLWDALAALRGGPGSDDMRAAIDAIESENRHYFLDREHSGMVRGYTLDEFMDLLDAGKAPPADVPPAPRPKRRRGK
jgi:hypothetical protein